jgi:hypothetical protein
LMRHRRRSDWSSSTTRTDGLGPFIRGRGYR